MGIYDYRPGTAPITQPGIQWVQGEGGAKSWMLPPNSTALLMDADQQRFYIKMTDACGMPSMRMFDYTEVTPNVAPQGAQTALLPEQVDNSYIKDELARISAKCDALESLVKEITKPKKTVVKKEAEDE